LEVQSKFKGQEGLIPLAFLTDIIPKKATIMKEKEIKELFGISHSTLHDWINKPNHAKKNLGIFLKALDYEQTKEKLQEELEKRVEAIKLLKGIK